MKIQVKGRNVAVTDALQEYAEEKLTRINRLLQERKIDEVSRLELELMVEKNPANPNANIAEATIFTRGPVIRAKESSDDMYAAIDLVADKVQRRVKKYHDKVHGKNHHKRPAMPETLPVPEEEAERQLREVVNMAPPLLEPDEEELDGGRVVKRKQFRFKPMSVEEATLQMELVGHDFFVFINADTNQTNVVYRRSRDNHYGLIEPER